MHGGLTTRWGAAGADYGWDEVRELEYDVNRESVITCRGFAIEDLF